MPLRFGAIFRAGDSGHLGADPKVPAAPAGPWQERRPELDDFETLVKAADAFRQSLAEAAQRVQEASSPLLVQVELCLGAAVGPDGAALAPRCAAQLQNCMARMQRGLPHLDAAQQLIQQARERAEEVHKAMVVRDAAWAPKVHCDEKVDELRQRFGPSFSLEEKKSRLQAKHSADETFRAASAEANRAFTTLLAAKPSLAGSIMAEFLHVFASVLGGAPDMAVELQSLAAALSELRSETAVPGLPLEPAPGLRPKTAEAGMRLESASELQPETAVPGLRLEPVPELWPETALEPELRPETPVPELRPEAAAPGVRLEPAAELRPETARRPQPETVREEAASEPLPETRHPEEALETDGGAEPERPEAAPALEASSRPAESPGTADGLDSCRAAGGAAAEASQAFAKGEVVQVWSSSAQTWLEGRVEERYDMAGVADGFWVPAAGVLKVAHAKGVKYITPEQVASMLRKPST